MGIDSHPTNRVASAQKKSLRDVERVETIPLSPLPSHPKEEARVKEKMLNILNTPYIFPRRS
jgi:hypothetical protein